MSIWRRGSLEENPYVRTAFRVARVPREVVRHRSVAELVAQTRRLVSADPKGHLIRGEPVTEAELNAAEQVLLDPARRVQEELLHHAEERLPLKRLRDLARELDAALADPDEGPLPVRSYEALRPWSASLVADWLATLPRPDPSLGALELELLPPFGPLEEE